jgi:hypothetical protein
VVARKVDVLRRHCADVGRDPAEVTVTNFTDVATFGTSPRVEDLVGVYRRYAEVGVQEAFVALDLYGTTDALERFAPVVAAFAPQ